MTSKMDYYGKRLATCSSDRTSVRIFAVTGDTHTHLSDLVGQVTQPVVLASPGQAITLPRSHASCAALHAPLMLAVVSPALLVSVAGHEGPVWQVCWAHPKFGSFLVSCSYDRKVIHLEGGGREPMGTGKGSLGVD